MTDLLKVYALVALALAAIGLVAYGWYKVERFNFDDCVHVGHAFNYCVLQYPFAAHR